MVMAGFLAIIADNLNAFYLSPQTVIFVGLFLGEITKALNNWSKEQPMWFAK